MSEQGRQTLIALAQMVYQTQDVVLEIIICEEATVAHLIPREIWEEEGGDFEE